MEFTPYEIKIGVAVVMCVAGFSAAALSYYLLKKEISEKEKELRLRETQLKLKDDTIKSVKDEMESEVKMAYALGSLEGYAEVKKDMEDDEDDEPKFETTAVDMKKRNRPPLR